MRSPSFELDLSFTRGASNKPSSIASSSTAVSSNYSGLSSFPWSMTGSSDELPAPNQSLIRDDLPPAGAPTYAASMRYESDLAAYHHSKLWSILDADARELAARWSDSPTPPSSPLMTPADENPGILDNALLPSLLPNSALHQTPEAPVKAPRQKNIKSRHAPAESPELSLSTPASRVATGGVASWLSMWLVPRGRSTSRTQRMSRRRC